MTLSLSGAWWGSLPMAGVWSMFERSKITKAEPANPGHSEDDSGVLWRRRDGAAKALRWSILVAPLVMAVVVSLVLNAAVVAPSSWSWAIVRVAVIAVVSMASIAVVERAGRRLLPLSSLLRLSLVF